MIWAILLGTIFYKPIMNDLTNTKFQGAVYENAQFENCRLVGEKYRCSKD